MSGVPTVTKSGKKRIFYFDALRALAILAVIFFHSSKRIRALIMSYYSSPPNLHWIFGDFTFAGLVIGVCLFLMLSGALSLGREWDIKTFLGKRIPRITEPFVFWGLVFSFIILFLQYQFPDLLHVVDTFDFNSIANFILGAFSANSFGFGPYWYFWMIFGIYLIMPVLNKWLLHADLKEAEYFLAIWLISCLFDYTLMIEFPIKITYFSGPIGMVVLGYYLRHTKRKIFSGRLFPIACIIVGLSCLLIGSYIFSSSTFIFKFSMYSIFSAIYASGIFLLFRNFSGIKLPTFMSNPNGIVRKSIYSLAKYSYGFYLIHQPVMDIFIKILKYFGMFKGYYTLYFTLGIVTLAVSWLIMVGLDRIPYVNKVIGAK